MNEEQKELIERQIKEHELTIRVLRDEKFMDGVFKSIDAAAKGDKGVRGRDLKRKYKKLA